MTPEPLAVGEDRTTFCLSHLRHESLGLAGRGANTVRNDYCLKHWDPEGYLLLIEGFTHSFYLAEKHTHLFDLGQPFVAQDWQPDFLSTLMSHCCCDSWHDFHGFKGKVRDIWRQWSEELTGQAAPSWKRKKKNGEEGDWGQKCAQPFLLLLPLWF